MLKIAETKISANKKIYLNQALQSALMCEEGDTLEWLVMDVMGQQAVVVRIAPMDLVKRTLG